MSRTSLALLLLATAGTALAGGYSGPTRPISVYISWAAHDELSDNVKLDEALADRELAALTRLERDGARFDYFLLDMSWFDPDGGYREFRKDRWPAGPERFFQACAAQGLKPGLWLSTNGCGWSDDPFLHPKTEWSGSMGGYRNLAMSFTRGGFLDYQIGTMQRWYDRGVRLFKFDFADFEAASPEELAQLGKAEVARRNSEAWRDALEKFRRRNPGVVLLAYNGYGGQTGDTYPKFTPSVDSSWLGAFDSLYCGDPKPADVPCSSFWRSLDVYSDAMVFQYAANGIPLPRIDSSGFMIGRTGTIYRRGKTAWKGTLILSGARGGLVNTYYGDFTLLDDRDGAWFGKVQRLYYPFQARGAVSTFGAYPGTGLPYGFLGRSPDGAVATVMNPGTEFADVTLPFDGKAPQRVLFSDVAGTRLSGRTLRLGPGQLAVVGQGSYADGAWDLGIGDDVRIPKSCVPLKLIGVETHPGTLTATVIAPESGALRIVCTQSRPDGRPLRLSGGAPPSGTSMGKLMVLAAEEDGRPLEMSRPYDRQIWSGISWALGEVAPRAMIPGRPVKITYSVSGKDSVSADLAVSAYSVGY